MTLLLKQIFGFLKLLNSDTGSVSISAGVAAGFILGMAPILSLQGLLVLGLILFFRIQIGAAFISAFFFAFVAFILDPVFHNLGESILTSSALASTWTTLFNMPLVPLTRFNNTIVMGAGIVSILLCPFVFIASKFLVNKYRIVVVERIKETKLWKAIKATSLFKWYYKYDNLYG
jgi:uncharacterized protein (TIGR03546 family)